jgi:hypothetical protein
MGIGSVMAVWTERVLTRAFDQVLAIEPQIGLEANSASPRRQLLPADVNSILGRFVV